MINIFLMGKYKASQKEVDEFVNDLKDAYNNPPNPGMVGVGIFLSKSKEDGKQDLVDKVEPIIEKINQERPFCINKSHVSLMSTKLKYF